ncbi:MAG: UMP kinase [Rickettsiales bacterium]|jgi:uridylate kinase|nr:UMP kinase [Rickettsiales bacterium]
MLKYKRILFKVSGESLMGGNAFGHDMAALQKTCKEITDIHKMGAEIAIVVGGGNIFRGVQVSTEVMDRVSADYMGMLATAMNGIALQACIEKLGVEVRMQSAIEINKVCEPYIMRKAIRHLEKNRVVIFVAGLGSPFFTTDTASVLRASEMQCDAVLKGTKVKGVYDKDPMKYPDAIRYDEISFNEAIKKDIRVMDPTALTLARDNKMPILVFKIDEKDSFKKVINGEGEYTVIKNN